jgi:hypothetical protein
VTVRAVSGEALAPTAVLAAVGTTCGPPPSSSLTQEALTCRVNSASSGSYGDYGLDDNDAE